MERQREELREILKVYVITDPQLSLGRSHEEVVALAIQGGCKAVQLRDKNASTRKLVQAAKAIREITAATGTLFIVNDRVDVAMAVGADGVHLGQDDLPLEAARKILGESKVIGISVETPEEAMLAEAYGADYLGVGPVFPTSTKPDAGPVYGPDIVARIREVTSLPIVAIGGINTANLPQVAQAGADGVAVVSAVVSKPDVAEAVRELLRCWETVKGVKVT
ncbi:MAG: thiamine phosphate synthase [Bacillota bacterium]